MRNLTAPVLVGLVLHGVALAADAPVTVSPGDPLGARIGDACPTFSWGEVDGAGSYELVVVRIGEQGETAEPMIERSFAGSVESWTPSLDSCLEPGREYAWSIRAVGESGESPWSEARLFRVSQGPSATEVEAALAVLRRWVEERAESEGAASPPIDAAASQALLSRYQARGPNRTSAQSSASPRSDREGAAALVAPESIEPSTPSASSPASLTLDSWVDLGEEPHFRMLSSLAPSGEAPVLWASPYNVGLGAGAGSALGGFFNTAIGERALLGATTGESNTAVGAEALFAGTEGNANTAIGAAALANSIHGSWNIALGGLAGYNLESDPSASSLSWNVFIGNQGESYDEHTIRIGTPYLVGSGSPDEGHLFTFIAGSVALGTEEYPGNRLVVKDQVDGDATPTNHVALIENTDTAGSADVLALKIAEPAALENDNNFVTFFNGDDTVLGEIEGAESVGVNYKGALMTLKPTDSPPACNAGRKGTMYFDDSIARPCYCDGSDWRNVIDAVGCT